MEAGEIVRWYPEPHDKERDVLLVGRIEAIENEVAEVKEAHAFHRLWGGSPAARGDIHKVPVANLEQETHYRDLVYRVLP